MAGRVATRRTTAGCSSSAQGPTPAEVAFVEFVQMERRTADLPPARRTRTARHEVGSISTRFFLTFLSSFSTACNPRASMHGNAQAAISRQRGVGAKPDPAQYADRIGGGRAFNARRSRNPPRRAVIARCCGLERMPAQSGAISAGTEAPLSGAATDLAPRMAPMCRCRRRPMLAVTAREESVAASRVRLRTAEDLGTVRRAFAKPWPLGHMVYLVMSSSAQSR